MGDRICKVATHLKENSTVYVGLGIGFVIGGVTVLVLKSRQTQNIVVSPVIAPVFNNRNYVTLGGYAHKVVKCLETGEIWESVTAAADAVGTTLPTLSKVLTGHTEHFDGKHYSIIALGCVA